MLLLLVEVRAKRPVRWLTCERSEPRNHVPGEHDVYVEYWVLAMAIYSDFIDIEYEHGYVYDGGWPDGEN